MKQPDARVLIYAKPSAQNVFPYKISVLMPSISSEQLKKIIVSGKSFYEIRNVYLSASDVTIFNSLSYACYNPFGNYPKLAPYNPPFCGVSIPFFEVRNENVLMFDVPDAVFYELQKKPIQTENYLDVIVENEAGYGLLTRDSIMYRDSSWRGFTQEVRPCVSGISIGLVENIPPTYININYDGFVIDVDPYKQYYFIIDENISTFTLYINGLDGVIFTNNYDINNYFNCNLGITTTHDISSDSSDVYITNSINLSTIKNEFFTFYYYTTGSIIAGFSPSSIPLTSPVVDFWNDLNIWNDNFIWIE